MNSPVEDIVLQSVSIDKNDKTAVYLQIAQHLIRAIQNKTLDEGTALPGTRSLSRLLKIHRNTAVAVYDELASQGWVAIVANKGTFVLYPFKQKGKKQTVATYPEKTGFPFYESTHLVTPYEKADTEYSFNDGQTDIRLHSNHQYNRWYNAALQRASLLKKWNTFLFDRSSFLNTQLCNYLNATRNFRSNPQNILITRSTEMSLYLISQLLIKPNDVVLVGNLSNFAANMIFSQAKAVIKTIPVDENGLAIDFIRENFTKNSIRLIYCTPNRHYPTTYSLSNQRRTALLQLAKEYGFAIVEDDFDYDFQFEGNHVHPLTSIDAHGSVIYLGKTGQALFPTFETGFIVAPANLISEAKNLYKMMDPQGDLIKEQIVAELIYEGEMHRQIKKKILLYKARRDAMHQALDHYFGHLIQYHKPTGGLAVFIRFKKHIALGKLVNQLKNYDITLPKYLLYQTKSICGIRLGFGHLTVDEIDCAIENLRKAYDDILS